jgi:tetratricopeptide (TPR) repeat protein
MALLRGDRELYDAIRANSGTIPTNERLTLLALASADETTQTELLSIANENFNPPTKFWHRFWCGQAQFRAGKLQKAAKTLEVHKDDWRFWPWLSLTYAELGNKQLASKYLDRTRVLLSQLGQMTPAQFADAMIRPGYNPSGWLCCTVLYREAKELIDGPAALAAEEERFAADQAAWLLERAQRDEAEFQSLVDQAGDDPAPWLRRARWYASRGELEKAIADCTKAIELDPDHGDAYAMRGNMLVAQDLRQQALADFTKVLALAPDNPAVWKARGRVYEQNDQWDQALADYQHAMELEPDNWKVWKSRAQQFGKTQQRDKAIALYAKLIELRPDDHALYSARAEIHASLKNYDQAIADYNEAIRRAPSVQLIYGRAGAHAMLGEYEKAEADARQAIELEPSGNWGWWKLIDVAFARNVSAEEARTIVEQAVTAVDGRMKLQDAAWNLLLDRRSEYETSCREAAARYAGSTNPKELASTARAAALADEPVIDPAQLVDMARRAVATEPTAWHQHAMGLCVLRNGQAETAIDWFHKSLGQNWRNGDAVNWLGLAIAHAAAGRPSESRDWLAKAEEYFVRHPLDLSSSLPSSDRIECQLLLREAKQLIRPKAVNGQ